MTHKTECGVQVFIKLKVIIYSFVVCHYLGLTFLLLLDKKLQCPVF